MDLPIKNGDFPVYSSYLYFSISFFFMGWLHQADMCCDFRLGIASYSRLIWLATEAVSCAQLQGSHRHGSKRNQEIPWNACRIAYRQTCIQTYVRTYMCIYNIYIVYIYMYVIYIIYIYIIYNIYNIYIRVYVPLSSLLSLCPAESSFV